MAPRSANSIADQMFYLRSRGVPQPEARAILIRAFLARSAGSGSPRTRPRGTGRRGRCVVEERGRMNVDHHPLRLNVARIREDFPILRPDHPRQAAGLPRQRRLRTEAPRRHRRHAHRHGDAIRQRPSRPALDERAHHRRLRSRPRCRRRADERAATGTRSSSSATPPRPSTSSPTPSAARCFSPARPC